MKNHNPHLSSIPLIIIALLMLPLASHAAITGQWDFKGSNLVATIGQDLQYGDTDTVNNTAFGSTTVFAISSIGGVPTNVMRFPRATDTTGGYYMNTGA